MKYIMVFLIGFGIGFFTSEVAHSNTLQCGLKPVTPLGCQATRCICVDDNCFWVIECDNE